LFTAKTTRPVFLNCAYKERVIPDSENL